MPALWPEGLGCPETGGFDLQVKAHWGYVSKMFDKMCNWAMVKNDNDELRGGRHDHRFLVYSPGMLDVSNAEEHCVVTLVVQGFLGKHSLGPPGNWNG